MFFRLLVSCLAAMTVMGCTALPGQGPSSSAFNNSSSANTGFEVVNVEPSVLYAFQSTDVPALDVGFGGSDHAGSPRISVGDVVSVTIWEAGAGGLFSATATAGASASGSQSTNIPEQEVGADGAVSIPYVGRLRIAGLSQSAAEQRIQSALDGRAIQPQVLLRVSQQVGSTVSVVGEVGNPGRIPLSQGSNRILDILASAGVSTPVDETMISLSRAGYTASVPMRTIVADPAENISLAPGDVVAVSAEPQVFFAVGATGRNDEIPFGRESITVQQAIARAGGLSDNRADPSGVFLLRLEHPEIVRYYAPDSPLLNEGGMVPVAYRFDMRDPYAMFLAAAMPMRHQDTLYVTNSVLSDLSKLTRLFSNVASPVTTTTGFIP